MIYIVGTGMDGLNTITNEAVKCISNCDLIIGAERVTKAFNCFGKPIINEYVSERIIECIKNSDCEEIAVVMSGDCGFYSGAKKLLTLLGDYETEVISGISSPVYFCSKLGMDWSDLNFVSLHGKSGNVVRNVFSHAKTFFLLGGKTSPETVCRKLCNYGFENLTVYIGENLAYDNEKIISGKAKNFLYYTSELCVMIVENPNYEKYVRSGINDNEFIRGKVPMTKSEVRNTVVSGFEIGKDSICWDIGSGTGSVAVEMAMRCTDGTVYAVERNQEAVKLINANRLKFGCDNIEVISKNAIDVIESLPVPDCVFVGGSGGELETIIKNAVRKNPAVRITVTAVSLETLNACTNIFSELEIETDIIQMLITRTKKVGSHTMLSAENPIFIVKRSS